MNFPVLLDWRWPALAVSVVDGDTLDVIIDRGFRDTSTMRVRLYGINTPERGEPGYVEATTRLRELVAGPLYITSVAPHDKYGRWLARIEAVGVVANVADRMISEGLGVPYFGGAK